MVAHYQQLISTQPRGIILCVAHTQLLHTYIMMERSQLMAPMVMMRVGSSSTHHRIVVTTGAGTAATTALLLLMVVVVMTVVLLLMVRTRALHGAVSHYYRLSSVYNNNIRIRIYIVDVSNSHTQNQAHQNHQKPRLCLSLIKHVASFPVFLFTRPLSYTLALLLCCFCIVTLTIAMSNNSLSLSSHVYQSQEYLVTDVVVCSVRRHDNIAIEWGVGAMIENRESRVRRFAQ